MISHIRKNNSQKHRREGGLRLTVSVALPYALLLAVDKARIGSKMSRSRWVELAIRAALGAVLLLASGCAGNVFKVDERFTPDEEQKIQAAADAWAAVGAPPVDFIWRQRVTEADTDSVIVRTTGRAAVNAGHDQFRDEHTLGLTSPLNLGGTRVYYAMDRLDDMPGTNLYALAVHEFGHVLFKGGNEVHIDRPDAIMNACPTVDDISPADVAELKARIQ